MRLLWLSNMAPGPVRQALQGGSGSGLWMDHMLKKLEDVKDLELMLLCPWNQVQKGSLSRGWAYETFVKGKPDELDESLESCFMEILKDFRPQVIHIWGTEFSHTLSMVRACEALGLLDRVVIGIQGLAHYVGRHYLEGLPISVQRRFTLRDFLRQDNLLQQQKTFLKRGDLEQQALKKVSHVIGRTHWDRACVRQLNPDINYHFCNESLRESFYSGAWSYEQCMKHRIFTSSRLYPIKGFHYMLEAFAEILKTYPDASLAVPGLDPCCSGRERLRQDSYARYLGELTRRYGLQGKIQYLGSLSESEMKEQFLKANVYVLPSTIENSSNSLGEAMLLGVPAVASMAGGTASMLKPGEGILYQSTAPYMLADAVCRIFAMGQDAEAMGRAAAEHGRKTHDPQVNFETLLSIYDAIGKGK